MGLANSEDTKMSNEIDAATLMSKQHGLAEIERKCYKFLKKLEADKVRTRMCRGVRDNVVEHVKKSNTEELVQCINQQGNDSVNLLSKQKLELADHVWNAIAEEEKQIILCGQSEQCFDRVIATIKDKITEVAHVIEDDVKIREHHKEVQLHQIKTCASRIIENTENSLNSIDTCSY
jgi:3-oxoacyl-ACP reductase-like protein